MLDLSSLTRTSEVVVNPDGTRTASVSPLPVREPDPASPTGWSVVDTSLVSTGSSVVPVRIDAPVVFSDGGADGFLARIGIGSDQMALDWLRSLPVPTITGDTATYTNVWPGVNVTVRATVDGFEQSFVVHQAPTTPLVFDIPLGLKGLSASTAADGSLVLTDTRTGLVRATTDPARVFDSSLDSASGDPTNSEELATLLVQSPSGPMLEVTVDPSFLQRPGLVYPVTVDPATNVSVVADTFVQSSWSSGEYANADMRIGTYGTYSGGQDVARSLIQWWPANAPPAWATASIAVTDATVKLYETWSSGCTATRFYAGVPTASWSQSSVHWTNKPGVGATFYGSRDAAVGNTGLGCPTKTTYCSGSSGPIKSVVKGASDWVTLNNTDPCLSAPRASIADLVQGWVDGSITNRGMYLWASAESSDILSWKKFAQSNAGAATAPVLVVTYYRTPDAPTPTLPANGATVTVSAPVLHAKFNDSAATGIGGVEFDIYPGNTSCSGLSIYAYSATNHASGTDAALNETNGGVAPVLPDGTFSWQSWGFLTFTLDGYANSWYGSPSACETATVSTSIVAPTPIAPVASANVSVSPTLSATYTSPDPTHVGTLAFQVFPGDGCAGTAQYTGSVTGLATGHSGGYAPTLAAGVYSWRASATTSYLIYDGTTTSSTSPWSACERVTVGPAITPTASGTTAAASTGGQQGAAVTFLGGPGLLITTAVSVGVPGSRLVLYDPTGLEVDSAGCDADPCVLSREPAALAGTYAVAVDSMSAAAAAPITFTLYAVSASMTLQAVVGGTPVAWSTVVPGDIAQITFPVAADASYRLSLHATDPLGLSIYPTALTVTAPDGGQDTFGSVGGDETFSIGPYATAGTASIAISGVLASAGAGTVGVAAAPGVQSTGMVVGDSGVTLTESSAAGWRFRLPFTTPATVSRVDLVASGVTSPALTATLKDASGTAVDSTVLTASDTVLGPIDVTPGATYTVEVTGVDGDTGAAHVALVAVPVDTAVVVDPAVPVATSLSYSVPRQVESLLYPVNVGDQEVVTVGATTAAGLTLVLSDATNSQVFQTSLAPNASFILPPATAAGSNTLEVIASDDFVGAVPVTVQRVSAPTSTTLAAGASATATIAPGGAALFRAVSTGPVTAIAAAATTVALTTATSTVTTQLTPGVSTVVAGVPASGTYTMTATSAASASPVVVVAATAPLASAQAALSVVRAPGALAPISSASGSQAILATTDVANVVSVGNEVVRTFTDPARGIELQIGGGQPFSIAPVTASPTPASAIAAGIVGYPAIAPSTDLAVQADPTTQSARIMIVVSSALAPTSFSFTVTPPDGGTLTATDDGGVAVTDADGSVLGRIAAPWAADAAGHTIPTALSASGTTLTLTVSHLDPSTIYPVVADPEVHDPGSQDNPCSPGPSTVPYGPIDGAAYQTGDSSSFAPTVADIDTYCATQNALLSRFSPDLRFDSAEPFYPMSVEAAFGTRHVTLQHLRIVTTLPRGRTIRVWGVRDPATHKPQQWTGISSLQQLHSHTNGKEDHNWRITLAPVCKANDLGNRPGCIASQPAEGHRDSPNHVTYAVFTRLSHPGASTVYYSLQYWFYYWADFWSSHGERASQQHQSDWEMVQVTVSEPSAGGPVTPVSVATSQHKCGDVVPWSLLATGGVVHSTHPVVYVARGSHSNWPIGGTVDLSGRDCWTNHQTAALGSKDTVPSTGHGTELAPYIRHLSGTRTLLVLRTPPGTTGLDLYRGYWGDHDGVRFGSLTFSGSDTGPDSPSTQAHWLSVPQVAWCWKGPAAGLIQNAPHACPPKLDLTR